VLLSGVAAEVGAPAARAAPLPGGLPPEAAVAHLSATRSVGQWTVFFKGCGRNGSGQTSAHLVEQGGDGVGDQGLRGVEELAGSHRAGGENAAAERLRQVHADRRRAAGRAGGCRRGGEEAAAEEHDPWC
jgi:hypothetical protein